MLFKRANAEIDLKDMKQVSPEVALGSQEITERFKKVAQHVKRVAPKSNEFLYFIARSISLRSSKLSSGV